MEANNVWLHCQMFLRIVMFVLDKLNATVVAALLATL